MDNQFGTFGLMLVIYAVPFLLFLIAGIIIFAIGYSKEKKPLKIAGTIISVIGFKGIIVLGALAVYFMFILSMVGKSTNY